MKNIFWILPIILILSIIKIPIDSIIISTVIAILENKNYSFIGFIILFFVIWCLVIISSFILKIITDFIINKITTVTKKTI